MRKTVICSGALYLAVAVASLQAGNLIVGNPPMQGTGNCDPFGCPQFFGLGTYQQVYSSTAFSSAIAIDGLTFYEGQIVSGAGVPGGTYTLTFSYTSDAPGDLSLTDPSDNIGVGSQGFFSGPLPALDVKTGGSLLDINGTPFVYNPADGNLLLTVTVTGATDSSPFLYLNEAACGPKTGCPTGDSVVSSNAYFGTLNGTPVVGGNDTGGLVTGFDFTIPAGLPTPEPGSLLLVLAGTGLIGYRRSRRSGSGC